MCSKVYLHVYMSLTEIATMYMYVSCQCNTELRKKAGGGISFGEMAYHCNIHVEVRIEFVNHRLEEMQVVARKTTEAKGNKVQTLVLQWQSSVVPRPLPCATLKT